MLKLISLPLGLLSVIGMASSNDIQMSKTVRNAEATKNQASLASFKACQTSDLSLHQLGGEGSMGHFEVMYGFTNTSSSTCTLYGYPKFVPLDAKGQQLEEIKVINNYLHQPKHLIIAPNAQASFKITYVHINSSGKQCSSSSKVKIALPNKDQYFTLVEHLRPCGEISLTPLKLDITDK